jgi:predicted nicotinamide N-methyase
MRRRYSLRTRTIQVADLALEITVAADPEQVLVETEQGLQAADKDNPRWQPYWAESWDSAVALGITLAERLLVERQVLDLGCGVGLAGIVAAARGARSAGRCRSARHPVCAV